MVSQKQFVPTQLAQAEPQQPRMKRGPRLPGGLSRVGASTYIYLVMVMICSK